MPFSEIRIVTSFLFFLLCLSTGLGQRQEFDSLKQQLKATKSPKEKAQLYIAVAKSIYYSQPDSSIPYCEEAEKISRKNNLDVELGYSLHCEARYILLKGDLKQTIEKLNAAISLFEKHNEKKGLAKCYSLKSIALGRLNKQDERLQYLLKAREIYKELNSPDDLQSALINLSITYCDRGEYDKSLEMLKEIESLNLPKNGTAFYLNNCYGNIYFDQNQFDKAIHYYETATQIAHQYKMLDSEITGLTKIAECYQKQKNGNAARTYFLKAIDMAKANHLMVEEADALKNLVKLYETDRQFEEAYFSLKHYKAIQDSIFTLEKIKNINEIENRLKLTEKEKIIAEQDLSLEKKKVELASTKNKALLLFAGLALVILAFIFLFYYNRRTKKLYSLIQKQKKEVEVQKEIIEAKNRDVMDSINYARYIQGSMLPSSKTLDTLFKEQFVLYKPKDIVAGDFYWTETIDNTLLLAACDCTGHGVPGAMVSIVACNSLNRAVHEFKLSDPARIFDKVNDLMQQAFSKSDYEVKDGMDGVLCAFDSSDKKLHIAAANNPLWIVSPPKINTKLWDAPWELSQVSPDKQPIGKYEQEIQPFNLKTVSVEKGEMIYLFSDGYADQFGGPNGKKFKYKQLQELLVSIARLPLKQQHDILDKTIEDWKGNLDQVDDIMIIGIRVQ